MRNLNFRYAAESTRLSDSVLSQTLFAGWHVAIPGSAAQLQQAAEIMYYGGDIAEMLLAIAPLTI
jgi:putative membrane protein